MSREQFTQLRNALDTLRLHGAHTVIISGSTKEIDQKIAESYNEDQIPKGKTLLCGVEIKSLS